jgi:hypothetical protein
MNSSNRLLPIAFLAITILAPAPTTARTFAQLACETRCMDQFRKCLIGGGTNDVDSGGYSACEQQAVHCKFGCTGALDPIAVSGIDAEGRLVGRGHRVIVTGHLACEAGSSYTLLAVTAVQGDAIAVTRTRFSETCNDDSQPWEVALVTSGPDAFVPGEAQLCAIAEVFDEGGAVATREWCVAAVLEE